MKIDEYKSGDNVEVLIHNPQTDKDIWVNAEVLDKRTIYPANGSHHRPYPILIVRLKRTYCKATPEYTWIDKNIPVFVQNRLEFYEKENDEGILYENQIRLKVIDNRTPQEIIKDAMNSIYFIPEEFKKKV